MIPRERLGRNELAVAACNASPGQCRIAWRSRARPPEPDLEPNAEEAGYLLPASVRADGRRFRAGIDCDWRLTGGRQRCGVRCLHTAVDIEQVQMRGDEISPSIPDQLWVARIPRRVDFDCCIAVSAGWSGDQHRALSSASRSRSVAIRATSSRRAVSSTTSASGALGKSHCGLSIFWTTSSIPYAPPECASGQMLYVQFSSMSRRCRMR